MILNEEQITAILKHGVNNGSAKMLKSKEN